MTCPVPTRAPAAERVLELAAAACLPGSSPARAALILKNLGPDVGVAALADALHIPPDRRRRTIEAARRLAEQALRRSRELGAQVIPLGEPGYPHWLAQIPDPPIVLWTLGNQAVLDHPSVAVVGSRRPSPGGVALALRLASDLARSGLAVTSGLAKGIDAAAHRGALDASGLTIAVLGSGFDHLYPADHALLADQVRGQGCLVSEFAPAVWPRAYHFPLRNRIISGLSRAVVVVEAAEKSGSLITARQALDQGRSVCAVPGPVAPGHHRGCHALIKDGARLVESVEDVLQELGLARQASIRVSFGDKPLSGNVLLDAMIGGAPVSVDALSLGTGLSGGALLAEISRLELAGKVQRMPGGLLVRLD